MILLRIWDRPYNRGGPVIRHKSAELLLSMWAHWWPGPRWGGWGWGRHPEGHWETGDAALLHRQVCLCCYGEEAATWFGLKGSQKRFNGGWLLISNQHIITVSYQLKLVPFWLELKSKKHHLYLLDGCFFPLYQVFKLNKGWAAWPSSLVEASEF